LQELLRGDVDPAQAVQELFVAEIEVLRDRQRRDQARLLKHHRDAVAQSLGRIGEEELLALERHVAGRRPIDARYDLAQRRLAGAVLAQQRMNLAALQGEADVLQRSDAVELLGDGLQFDDRRHAQAAPLDKSRAMTSSPPLLVSQSRPSRSTTSP
jgi:hypothetical protein